MADIGIFHIKLADVGGADTILLHTLNALTEDHDVTLYMTDEFDKKNLESHFGVEGTELEVTFVDPLEELSAVDQHISGILERFAPSGPVQYLRRMMGQIVLRRRTNHDLYISTNGELFTERASIQYIHFPIYSTTANACFQDNKPTLPLWVYKQLCYFILNQSAWRKSQTKTLVNSKWSKKVVKQTYDIPATVLYPPVAVNQFDGAAWDEREDGFVMVGRVSPQKRQEAIISLMDQLQSNGYDVHLHIIGSIPDTEYSEHVKTMVDERSYVHLEGRLERGVLVELLETHRFGIHGHETEHFGIAVAEIAAAGCIPFVPDDGGQVEIVDERDELVYADIEDAANKIANILSDPKQQSKLSNRLQERVNRFSTDRFEEKMQAIVSEELEEES